MGDEGEFTQLLAFLERIPGAHPLSSGRGDDGRWWVKLAIDIEHALAWQVVQELGHVLNYLSLNERLPTVFMPVSPSPSMNGGPKDFLSWVIESKTGDFEPQVCAEWLEGRLPRPVEDLAAWSLDDEEGRSDEDEPNERA